MRERPVLVRVQISETVQVAIEEERAEQGAQRLGVYLPAEMRGEGVGGRETASI